MLCLVSIILLSQLVSTQVQEPLIRAEKADEPPVVDGRLDDPCWELCTPTQDFYLVEPKPGGPVTQPTRVYVCYDNESVYFGIHMSEDEPDRMQAVCNQRDGTVYLDDSFEIILDTYCDRRNAYYFMSNLLGTKLDGRIIDEGRYVDETWDGHWETRSQLADDGWEMEMSIPFSELSFQDADSLVWGLNFWRIERPHWESTSWAPVQRWNQVSRYGTLTGINIKPSIKRVEILPYGALWYEQYEVYEDSFEAKAGVDLQYDVTPSLVFNATMLPDFAQIEADPLRFNLSYQEGEELYFPEKRPFFLEGSSILLTPLQLFYTRRVKEIVGGSKLYGRMGSTELVALAARTRDPREDFSVLRVKQELFGPPTLGLLLTHKSRSDTVSQAFGIDLNAPTHGPFLLTTQLASTHNTGVSGDSVDQWAGLIGLQGETSSYSARLSAFRTGREFWVDQGFIQAYDMNREGVEGGVSNRLVQDRGWFQWINGYGSFELAREIGGDVTESSVRLGVDFVTRPKWRLSLGATRSYQYFPPADTFTNMTYEIQLESNVGGMTGVSATLYSGRLYGDTLDVAALGFLFMPLKKMSVFPVLQGYRSRGYDWRNRWSWLTNTRISYQVTDKAFVRVFLRADSESRHRADSDLSLEQIDDLNSNLLFGYEFAAGTMLYLVYNLHHAFDMETTDHILVSKFTYSFRL